MLNAQMNMYLCYHYVLLLLLLLLLTTPMLSKFLAGNSNIWIGKIPNFGRKFKFEMQNANANAKGKCNNRLSVKPFIATALFSLVVYFFHDNIAWAVSPIRLVFDSPCSLSLFHEATACVKTHDVGNRTNTDAKWLQVWGWTPVSRGTLRS